jgi:pyruvate formate lyase activating enzyme
MGCCALGAALFPSALRALGGSGPDSRTMIEVDRKRYAALAENVVQCELCPNNCALAPGETSRCHSRVNHDGRLFSHAYNNPCVITLDPVEKLPLNHFRPGITTLSLAIGGCNLSCLYCQNWEQSQTKPEDLRTTFLSAGEAVRGAREKKCAAISFTYTEPTVAYEYTREVATQAKSQGLLAVMATNAHLNPGPLTEICESLDAVVVTLKGFSEDFYQRVCNAQFRPVLASLEAIRKSGKWLEIVNLVLPTYNDDPKKVREMCRWIKVNLGAEVPLQFGRFVPQFKLKDLPRTPSETLEQCRAIGFEEGLQYVYITNLAPHDGNNTWCPRCKIAVVKRLGFKVLENILRSGVCPKCGQRIPGVWA